MSRRRHKIKSQRAFRLKLKKSTIYSVAQIIFFLIAGLITISFSRRGLVLNEINDFLTSLFSWTAVFLPFIFLVFGLLVSKFRFPLSQPNVLIGSLLFFLSVLAVSRAGILGKASWDGFVGLVTPAGSYIILLGTTVIGLIITFNTSLDQVISSLVKFLVLIRGFIVGRGQKKEGKIFSGLFRSPKKASFEINVGSSQGKKDGVKKEEVVLPESTLQVRKNIPPGGEEKVWVYPEIDLLSDEDGGKADRGDIKGNAATIEQTLESFGIYARVKEVNLGPAVTQYALEVALGTKLSKITALERDLALALAAPTGTIRIEAPIPGRSLVGIELPNKSPEFVSFKKMITSEVMIETKSKLTVALGLDVSGKPIVANLSKMPHVLIAGQTGSGKSVSINSFLASLLFRATPSEVKLILVDPKRVELIGYNGIPHLLTPVIVEPPKVISALRWILNEMEARYKLFAEAGARNIDSYNEASGFQALPYVVLVIDELADIMLFSPVEVEDSITRIAQMSRATGIHMVLATQRPSVDVITGLIKANIPCRIAFAVASQIDSRVILDTQGAEKLLGRGDMLFLPPEQAKPIRIQGSFISDADIGSLTAFLRNQGVSPQYTEELTEMPRPGSTTVTGVDGEMDPFFADAVRIVCQYERASSSLLQRRLSVGYARAARIIDQLEAAGVVSAPDSSSKAREVLIQSAEGFLSSSVKK